MGFRTLARRARLGLAGALALLAASAAAGEKGTVVVTSFHAPSLERSGLGTEPERRVHVYLPPGYEGGAARYPVAYLLHGFGGSAAQWTERQDGWSLAAAMDRLIAAGKARAMIVVMPDAQSPLLGSAYVNSAPQGRWEDFVVRDLVGWADRTYRTIPAPASRALAGHSMGGYGALRIAMRHGDVFGVAYGISPCCLDWGKDLSPENPRAFGPPAQFPSLEAFRATPPAYPHLAFAIASAWTPDPKSFQPLTPATIDADGHLSVDGNVKARWEAMMPVRTAAQDAPGWRRLQAVGLEVGTGDEYPHILAGTRALHAKLKKLGVPHSYAEHDGRHGDRLPQRLEAVVLPFLAGAVAGP